MKEKRANLWEGESPLFFVISVAIFPGGIMKSKILTASVLALFAFQAPVQAAEDFASLAKASLATVNGTLKIPGVKDQIEIRRDENGVPHIYAKNTYDLFFAQGFVIAQDRLWELEMTRHVSQGRVAELIGPAGLPHDKLVRTLTFHGPYDDGEWTNYHPEARLILGAYADGVNAFIRQAGDNLPVEFKITGRKPAYWKPEEILTRARVSAAVASGREELRLAQQVAILGAEEANRRDNPVPYGDLVVPRGVDYKLINDEVINALRGEFAGDFPAVELLPPYKILQNAMLTTEQGAPELAPGSNNFAVRGSMTKSGLAMMADDPHRQVTLPAWRYVIHLSAPGWDVIGATEPGLPGVIRGHNGRVAWGRTATGTDEADVFVETVNPADPNQVMWNGSWEPLSTITEVINVKGEAPQYLDVKVSRHGPVFYRDTKNNLAYVLKSSLQEQGTAEYIGALRLDQASGASDCIEMAKFVKSPPTNLVCADSAGNIAFKATIAAPNRSGVGFNGRLPVPGTGAYEWAGLRTDSPSEYNPARGYIATANHNIHPDGYGQPLFYNKRTSWRVDRISKLLETGSKKYAPADFVKILRDNYSTQAEVQQPNFVGWKSQNPDVERARAAVEKWDRVMLRTSQPAAIFATWLKFSNEDDLAKASADQKRQMTEASLVKAIEDLNKTQGSDPAKWRYGIINRSVFAHALVKAYDLPTMERDGGFNNVNAVGAVYRIITDFSNLDGSLYTIGPGQSGQPGSPHYGDLLERWINGTFWPLHYSRQAVVANTKDTLVLNPVAQ